MTRTLGTTPNQTGSITDVLAWLYEKLQYGTIPEPTVPTAQAPQTEDEMTGGYWKPADAMNSGDDWYTATAAKIQAAEKDGSYNPAGNLSFTAEWLDRYKWLIIGAGIVGALVVWHEVKP